MINIQHASLADADELGQNIRREQRLEVLRSHGLSAADAASESIAASAEAWSFRTEEGLLGLAGVVPHTLVGGYASPWLLTTEAASRYPRLLLSCTKPALARWLETWDVLENYIDADYTASLRWAKWAGFTILPAAPYGASRALFHKIQIRKPYGC